MFFQECETMELKAIVVEDIKKEVIAFVNGDGGQLYVGVNEVEEAMGISASSATRLLRKMIEDGVVLREGKAKSTRYRLKG